MFITIIYSITIAIHLKQMILCGEQSYCGDNTFILYESVKIIKMYKETLHINTFLYTNSPPIFLFLAVENFPFTYVLAKPERTKIGLLK